VQGIKKEGKGKKKRKTCRGTSTLESGKMKKKSINVVSGTGGNLIGKTSVKKKEERGVRIRQGKMLFLRTKRTKKVHRGESMEKEEGG